MRDPATRRSCGLAAAAALVAVLTSAVNAGQGPAAVVERVSSSQQDAYAAWDSCADTPMPGEICIVTAITAGQASNAVSTFGGLTVNRGVYEVTSAGEKQWRDDDSWYAISDAAIQFSMDRGLNSASASGVARVVTCGVGGSACGGTAREVAVSVTWSAAGDATTLHQRSVTHFGLRMGTGRSSVSSRPAVASATVDGEELGVSRQGWLEAGEVSEVGVDRSGGVNGLGQVAFPLWRITEWGSGAQASAQLDTCGDATAGDTCAVTQIIAADWTDYGWTQLWLRRFTFEIADDGERLPRGNQETLHTGPVKITVDRHLNMATATGVVEFTECTGEPPAPGGPPPPEGQEPQGNCSLVPHEVSVHWTAIGGRVHVDSSRSVRDPDDTFTEKRSTDFRPAVAQGTFDGKDMGESTWAAIIDREERLIVNGNGRTMTYFPPWAITPSDATAKVAAEWDTCEHAARDGLDIDDPDPGDICVWTLLTAHEPSASADGAQMWVLQVTHRYGEADPVLIQWWEGRGTVELTVDRHLNTATVAGRIGFVGCSEQPDRSCSAGTREIAASWQAVEQTVRMETEQFRLSTATGTLDGEEIPGSTSRWAVIGGPLPGISSSR